MMAKIHKFLIKYICPVTGKWTYIVKEFEDIGAMTAEEYAHSYASTIAFEEIFTVEKVGEWWPK